MKYFLNEPQFETLEREVLDAPIVSGGCDQRGPSAL